jgi:hypothetical protein
MPSYRARIEAAIAPLLTEGFRVTAMREDPEHFGDTEVVLTSTDLTIRILSDRGQTFADVSKPRDATWYDLIDVLSSMGARSEAAWGTPEEAVSVLRSNLQSLRDSIHDRSFLSAIPAKRKR